MKALIALVAVLSSTAGAQPFRAGAFAVDITPTKFPVIVNGGFLERVAAQAHDRLYARAIVMERGNVRVAVIVVDSCMMPRDLLDRAKIIATRSTGIPTNRILISRRIRTPRLP